MFARPLAGRVNRWVQELEALEARNTPSCLAAFDPALGQLSIVCDEADDEIVLSISKKGRILVNGSPVDGKPSVVTTAELVVLGGDGNDRIDLQALIGFKGTITVDGEAGNDVLLGSPGNDVLAGGDGIDRLYGGGGDDVLFGGAGNDYLDGGRGTDYLFGDEGDDQLIGGGIDGVTDYFWGGEGRDLFVIEPTCSPWPEEEVLDAEVGDHFAQVYYFRDPCEPYKR